MVGCSVGPCKGGNTGKSEFQSFTFPKGAMREKWIQQINRENFVPGEYSTVCKRHFQERDIICKTDKDGRIKNRHLKANGMLHFNPRIKPLPLMPSIISG